MITKIRALTELHRSRRVLVGEDDDVLRVLLARRLTRVGYLVRAAADGEQVMELMRHGELPEETLLLDVHMPKRTGMEVVQALRASGSRVAVVLMSAYTTDELKAEARSLGVAAVLDKPFESTSLETALANAETLSALALAEIMVRDRAR